MTHTHKATFYVQVQRKSYPKWRNGKPISASAIKMTQEKPSSTPKDTVTVKLTVELPDNAFEPFEPSAVVSVPASQVQSSPLHVIIEDAAS